MWIGLLGEEVGQGSGGGHVGQGGVGHVGRRAVWYGREGGVFLLQSVTTKGNHLSSHDHKGGRPIKEDAYKILYPLGGRPIPSGCTGVNQSDERDPSNITLYG